MGSDSKYNSAPGGYTDFNPRSRTGSDGVSLKRCTNQANFNPRSRMGSDIASFYICASFDIFQSTLPHGERPSAYYRQDIHRNFNPRPPAWGATGNAGEYDIQQFISIHAPRMGSDDAEVENQGKSHHFNPRPPHGERLSVRSRPITAFTFQSTLPAWGATTYDYSDGYLTKISIHAPRMGSDIDCYELKALTFKFQSTLPAWGATVRI